MSSLLSNSSSISTPQHTPNYSSTPPESLPPESDLFGHIEYKLKLVNPTRLRISKLATQLKWRLISGCGEAVYELGVLDDGTLIGISRKEMKISLSTLGTMLSSIGGGTIEIAKVVVLGGTQDSEEDSDGSDTDIYNAAKGDRSVNAGFESFHVTPDLTDPPLAPPIPIKLIRALVVPIPIPITLPQHSPKHVRSPGERDAIKQQKRDDRRARRLSEGISPVERIWNDRNPDYVAPVKIAKVAKPAPIKETCLHLKPAPMQPGSRARYIVEAVVTRLAASRQEQESEELVDDEPTSGFDFLDFASACSL